MDEKGFYVTTPIYYVNDVPHIGHAYTTVAADALARFQRLRRRDVLFLTGTDEHGQKVEKAASLAGLKPIELADRVVTRFRDLWKKLNISNDDFIRTTEKRHTEAAIKLWEEVSKKGDIYLGEYEDWYCTPCENFLTETQLVEGKCPDCGRAVERLRESSYFFRLSKYERPLLELYESNPDLIRPENRRNEIISFVRQGLRDLSISRTTFSWGIPVPGDPAHVMYVWFDALTNYLTAAGYPGDYKRFWPADVHIIGKDILRFHAVYWPAFLMSAGIEPPRSIFAHGWWTVEGRKMSKSLGNVVDPGEVAERYGVDQFRYFLLREVPFGLDGDFSTKALVNRINSDLANDLGNLLSRTVSMVHRYRKGRVPGPCVSKDRAELEAKVRARAVELKELYTYKMERLDFYEALSGLWTFIKGMNHYVDRAAPWKEDDEDTLSNVLYTLTEGLRITALYVWPFMPKTAETMWKRLGVKEALADASFDEAASWSAVMEGAMVEKGGPLFPRIG